MLFQITEQKKRFNKYIGVMSPVKHTQTFQTNKIPFSDRFGIKAIEFLFLKQIQWDLAYNDQKKKSF